MIKTEPIQNFINHIVFVVDSSGSMSHLSTEVVKVFDNQIKHLAMRSKEMDQETRASVYLFSDRTHIKCLLYDMDVMRLPSLAGYYFASGQTALIEATRKAIFDLKQTPELYGDHAFLIYVLTDGQENCSQDTPMMLSKSLSELKDNWTVAVLVPDALGMHEAKRFGFPPDNISIWDSSSVSGLGEAGRVIREATDQYMSNRAQGIRGTKNLFRMDVTVSPETVKQQLGCLDPSAYRLFSVNKDMPIKDFVESWLKSYRVGSAYYQITKPEVIQSHKQVCIQDKRTGKMYVGLYARQMLSLPNHEVKVVPGNFKDFDIFIQSTSVNRKLVGGTKLIVMI